MEKEIKELYKKLKKSPVFYIKFSNSNKINYLNSKIGGSFYWPDNNLDELNGLQFLAQINFSELPENNLFPKSGLLQFFIGLDDAYGLFNDKYLIIYHSKINESGKEIVLPTNNSPIYFSKKMKFTFNFEYLSSSDYRFNNYVKDKKYSREVEDRIYEEFNGCGHKLLGYPAFAQYDPRGNNSKYDTLLFQLDSEDNIIMWGDCGVCNFFINKDDLKKLNFSNVLYNWDCC